MEVAFPEISCTKIQGYPGENLQLFQPQNHPESIAPPAVSRVRASDLKICSKPRDVMGKTMLVGGFILSEKY